jgi:hypothetical protein
MASVERKGSPAERFEDGRVSTQTKKGCTVKAATKHSNGPSPGFDFEPPFSKQRFLEWMSNQDPIDKVRAVLHPKFPWNDEELREVVLLSRVFVVLNRMPTDEVDFKFMPKEAKTWFLNRLRENSLWGFVTHVSADESFYALFERWDRKSVVAPWGDKDLQMCFEPLFRNKTVQWPKKVVEAVIKYVAERRKINLASNRLPLELRMNWPETMVDWCNRIEIKGVLSKKCVEDLWVVAEWTKKSCDECGNKNDAKRLRRIQRVPMGLSEVKRRSAL